MPCKKILKQDGNETVRSAMSATRFYSRHCKCAGVVRGSVASDLTMYLMTAMDLEE
jgi:hypothetical protein